MSLTVKRTANRRLLLVVALVVAGCNRGGLELVSVEGVVTYDGSPVDGAGVMFVPAQGLPAMGTTNSDGEFSLMTANQEGAVVGEHRVSISKVRTVAIPQAHGYPEYRTSHLIPEKYSKAATSGLIANVDDDNNHYEFKLSQ